MHHELSCQLDGKLATFEDIDTAVDLGRDYEGVDPRLALKDLVLEAKRILVLVLTTGGPHVEVQVELDAENAIVSAILFGRWGSAEQSRTVCPEIALFRAVRRYVEAEIG